MRWIGYILHALLGLGLVLAYAAPAMDPRAFWPPAFAGLGFPLLVLGNVFFGLLWLALRKWKGLAFAVLLFLPGLGVFSRYVQLGGSATASAEARTEADSSSANPAARLRVLSWKRAHLQQKRGRYPLCGKG